MTQMVLPIFPEGMTMITPVLGFEKRDGHVYYFHGGIPVFSHKEDDTKSFRMFVSQLVINGNCRQVDIIRTFGIPSISMKRAVKLYRERGPAGFFEKKKRVNKSRVLTPDVIKKAQALLDEGKIRAEVAKTLEIKPDTFYKAVRAGKLVEHPTVEKKTKVTEE